MTTNCKRLSSIRSSSAAIIGGNDDLLMEILILLPAKSLIRFKLVSKHWSSLISDTSFCRNHTLRHRPRPGPRPSLLLRDALSSHFFICSPTVKKLVHFYFRFPFVKILQSCNGLLLLECKNSRYGRKVYCVFNPTTMQSRNLLLRKSFVELFLAYDPSKSPHYVVFLFRSGSHYLLYDSETHTWKEMFECDLEQYKGCDGIICWKDCSCFIRSGASTLHLFNDGMSFPVRSRNQSQSKKSYIVKSNGNMHCIILYLRANRKSLIVGECDGDISNCSRKYRVDLNPISATFPGNKGIDMLGMIRVEREEDSVMLFHVPGKIMVYKFIDKIFEELVDFSETQLQFGFKDAHPFIESLAPV